MNYWMNLSIEYANQKNYLDELYRVYPTIPNGIRKIDPKKWSHIEYLYNNKLKKELILNLLDLELFPIKDSYIAYLKRDRNAINRNPETINRIYGRLRELGLTRIFEKSTEPKETNRQMGPKFRNWLKKETIGVPVLEFNDFMKYQGNCILDSSDNNKQLKKFLKEDLNYKREKGIDFLAKFNNKYVIGEAKFLTDFGGHQNAQFEDAISLLKFESVKAIKIGILDGVLYIEGNNKMYRSLLKEFKDYNIMSALVLNEFLYQV